MINILKRCIPNDIEDEYQRFLMNLSLHISVSFIYLYKRKPSPNLSIADQKQNKVDIMLSILI